MFYFITIFSKGQSPALILFVVLFLGGLAEKPRVLIKKPAFPWCKSAPHKFLKMWELLNMRQRCASKTASWTMA